MQSWAEVTRKEKETGLGKFWWDVVKLLFADNNEQLSSGKSSAKPLGKGSLLKVTPLFLHQLETARSITRQSTSHKIHQTVNYLGITLTQMSMEKTWRCRSEQPQNLWTRGPPSSVRGPLSCRGVHVQFIFKFSAISVRISVGFLKGTW